MATELDERALCDAIMDICGGGAQDIDAIVAGLNVRNFPSPAGAHWSVESLRGEFRRAAPAPHKQIRDVVVTADNDLARAAEYRRPPRPGLPQPTIADRTELLLATGLRNRWYLIASSAEIGQEPVGMTRLSENIVLWRDPSGSINAIEDRCPHRGVKLSIGDVVDGLLRCAYHGVEVDGYGKVEHVPALPGCPLEGRTVLKHYPIIEQYQAVFAYFGDDAHREPPPLELPAELVRDDWSGMLYSDVWHANYRYVYDNLVDPMHTPFLHGETYTLQYGKKDDKIAIRDTGHGFETYREGQTGVNADCLEWVESDSSFYSRVEIPLPPTVGPGGSMWIIFFATPVDTNSTRINIYRMRNVVDWQQELWTFLFKFRMDGYTNHVVNQDKRALEAMPPWPAEEGLYQHDAGVTKLRRHIERLAKAQAEALVLQPA